MVLAYETPRTPLVPAVAVVIPTYNGERYLAATLDQLLAQRFPSWEAVIVDDGSSDGSMAIARRYAQRDRRIRVLQQRHGGVARARNHGLAATSAPRLMFLDQDDLLEPDALSILMAALDANLDAPAAHGAARVVDDAGRSLDWHGNPWPSNRPEEERVRRRAASGNTVAEVAPRHPTSFAMLAVSNPITTPGQALIRRHALKQVGGFDPAMCPADDWELFLRLATLGPLAYVHRVVISWHRHGGNATHNRRVMDRAMRRVRRSIRGSGRYTPEQRRLSLAGEAGSHQEIRDLRLAWARGALRQRDYRGMIAQLRHAAVCELARLRCCVALFGAQPMAVEARPRRPGGESGGHDAWGRAYRGRQ